MVSDFERARVKRSVPEGDQRQHRPKAKPKATPKATANASPKEVPNSKAKAKSTGKRKAWNQVLFKTGFGAGAPFPKKLRFGFVGVWLHMPVTVLWEETLQDLDKSAREK